MAEVDGVDVDKSVEDEEGEDKLAGKTDRSLELSDGVEKSGSARSGLT